MICTSGPQRLIPSGRGSDYSGAMPQKPQDRAKEKRRLTRRLAAWRLKNAAQQPKEATNAAEKKS